MDMKGIPREVIFCPKRLDNIVFILQLAVPSLRHHTCVTALGFLTQLSSPLSFPHMFYHLTFLVV